MSHLPAGNKNSCRSSPHTLRGPGTARQRGCAASLIALSTPIYHLSTGQLVTTPSREPYVATSRRPRPSPGIIDIAFRRGTQRISCCAADKQQVAVGYHLYHSAVFNPRERPITTQIRRLFLPPALILVRVTRIHTFLQLHQMPQRPSAFTASANFSLNSFSACVHTCAVSR